MALVRLNHIELVKFLNAFLLFLNDLVILIVLLMTGSLSRG